MLSSLIRGTTIAPTASTAATTAKSPHAKDPGKRAKPAGLAASSGSSCRLSLRTRFSARNASNSCRQRRHVVPLQAQLLCNFVITQFAVIAQDQRHAMVLRQTCDGIPHPRPLLCAEDCTQRRQLRAGCLDDRDSCFNFHNHLLSTLPAPQSVNALVTSHP